MIQFPRPCNSAKNNLPDLLPGVFVCRRRKRLFAPMVSRPMAAPMSIISEHVRFSLRFSLNKQRRHAAGRAWRAERRLGPVNCALAKTLNLLYA
jgi:hypothetical protein